MRCTAQSKTDALEKEGSCAIHAETDNVEGLPRCATIPVNAKLSADLPDSLASEH